MSALTASLISRVQCIYGYIILRCFCDWNTEAEYTFRLHKSIIPLRLENRYYPDGWLGALCGNNLIYDFSVPIKFEDSMTGLIGSLQKLTFAQGSGTFANNTFFRKPSVVSMNGDDW
jgi:hypothetical protein